MQHLRSTLQRAGNGEFSFDPDRWGRWIGEIPAHGWHSEIDWISRLRDSESGGVEGENGYCAEGSFSHGDLGCSDDWKKSRSSSASELRFISRHVSFPDASP
jgi:hypothetical protein